MDHTYGDDIKPMKKLLLLLSLLLATNAWGETSSDSFNYYCTEEEKVMMDTEEEVTKSESYITMKIKGECKDCNEKKLGKAYKYEVVLEKSDSLSEDQKFKCFFQPMLASLSCTRGVRSLLAIKLNTSEFFLVEHAISRAFGYLDVSKGSCVSFKP